LEGWRHGVNPVGENGMVQNTHQFTFDHVYDQDASQETVYENSAKPAVMSTLLGYNAAMMAYGQTGTGKTYTMEGDRASMKARAHGGGAGRLPGEPGDASASGTERGIIPRAIEDIFGHIKSDTSTRSKYLVRASYVQIYNEVISDLLKPERANLNIREDKKRGVFVDGLSEWVVRTPDEIYGLMEKGATQRTTGSTKMNELSSRSHAVFIIIVENSKLEEEPGRQELRQSFKVGKLNLVDLAGSERVRQSGATGVRLEETKKINQSLSALGNVIKALTDKVRSIQKFFTHRPVSTLDRNPFQLTGELFVYGMALRTARGRTCRTATRS
jgi:kinesin family protein 3/17